MEDSCPRIAGRKGRKRVPAQKRPALVSGLVLLAVLLSSGPAPASDRQANHSGAIGVVEKLGQAVPGDIVCLDDAGKELKLGALLDRPVILSLVYYSCEHICPQVLAGLGQLVSGLALKAGRDYRLITFSFDGADTPADAAVARKNYTRPLGEDFPPEGWAFLTAAGPEIDRLIGALGFSCQKEEHGFTHPAILAILAPGGKISRYVHVSKYNYGVGYPVVFSVVEMTAALRAAERGLITAGPGAPLLFCFPHEPEGQAGFFRLTRIAGAITLVGLAVLFVVLAFHRRSLREES
jgi:protein SCO1/2